MHTTTLIPQRPPSLAEFKAFVESLPGGVWGGAIGIPRGVVEAERGHVYIDYDDQYGQYFEKYLNEQRKVGLLAQLGSPPQLALHVQASVADVGSNELAAAISGLVIEKWGGVLE